jgi:hypothetical protein
MGLGTITGVFTRLQTDQQRPKAAKLVLTCTAGAAGDANAHLFPATILNSLAALSGLFHIEGMMIRSIKAIPDSGTPPTASTSLTITDEYGVDLLDGAGNGFIPSSGNAWSMNTIFPALISGNITLNITGNLVNGAIVTIVIELIGT